MRKWIAVVLMMILALSGFAEEDARIPELLSDSVKQLCRLSGDANYLNLMTENDEIREILNTFHSDSQNGIVDWKRIEDADLLLDALGVDLNTLSEAARENLRQRLYSASYLASVIASRHGLNALAATSLLSVCEPLAGDLPSALYAGRCENNTGVIMGVWNNGNGLLLVTASFVPDIGVLETGLSALFE